MDLLKFRARSPQFSPVQVTLYTWGTSCDLHYVLGRVGIRWTLDSATSFEILSHIFAFGAELTEVKWFAVGAEEEGAVEALKESGRGLMDGA